MCGGVLSAHQLTGDREAWSCRQCGRYEALQRSSLQLPHSTDPVCIIPAPSAESLAMSQSPLGEAVTPQGEP